MNESYLLAGVGALIVIALLMWLSRKNSAKDTFTGNVDSSGQTDLPSANSSSNIAPGSAEAEVCALLNSGKKIEAIKRVREQTGLGLKEAKDLVDALERGLSVSIHAGPHSPAGFSNPDDEARKLVAAGKLIEAVKLVREHKHLGLKEAKDYVDRL